MNQLRQRKQQTLKKKVTFSGIGIHTGQVVSMQFCPADVGTGIVFKRTDLETKPLIPAMAQYVCDTSRSTTIGKDQVCIHTVEHVLAALYAYGIDNLIVELSSIEPPIGDGGSKIFAEMIEEGKVQEQEEQKEIISLKDPVWFTQEDISIVAIPSEEFRISYTLNYPGSEMLKAQFQSFAINAKCFKDEIAPCRTFACYEEISALMDRGLIQGGSLDNAVVIKDGAAISKEGLHFPDEMVRHKILDLVGDLALCGKDVQMHVIAIRSGHATNVAFAKKLQETLT